MNLMMSNLLLERTLKRSKKKIEWDRPVNNNGK